METAAQTGQEAASKLIESGLLGTLVVVLALALAVTIWYFWRENKADRKAHDLEIKAKDEEIARLNAELTKTERNFRTELATVDARIHDGMAVLAQASQALSQALQLVMAKGH